MTADKLLYQTLSEVCPGTYAAYKPGNAPPLPWFVYKVDRGGEVFADNTNYSKIPRYRVELLMKEKDPSLVDSFEAALRSIGTWRLYDADYIDSEGCVMHDYRLALDVSLLRESESSNAG